MEGLRTTSACAQCTTPSHYRDLDEPIVRVMRAMLGAIHDIRKVNSDILHGFFNLFPDGNTVVIAQFMERLNKIKNLNPYKDGKPDVDIVQTKLVLVKQVYDDLITFVESKEAAYKNNPDSYIARQLLDAVQPLVYAFGEPFHF